MAEFIRVGAFGGVGLYYDRSNPEDYGVNGVPMRPYVEVGFAQTCDLMFTQLFAELAAHNIGLVDAIFSGGVSRDPSTGGASYHTRNRAFDLDALIFEEGHRWIATSYPSNPHLYLGIEAILRLHFGTVLAYTYNAAHRDHFHFDDGTRPGFNTYSKSRVSFLQNCLFYLFDRHLGLDGVYGPETKRVSDGLRQEFGLGGFSQKENWLEFVQLAATEAFGRVSRSMHVSGEDT